MYNIPSWTIRNVYDHRTDPKPRKENIFLREKWRLQSSATCHCKQAHNSPLAVAIRVKEIKLRNSTSITFHWVKRHTGLKGSLPGQNSCEINNTIADDEIPINRVKQIPEDYYTKIWNDICKLSKCPSNTKLYIPTILYRLSLPLWSNFLLTQFLTSHGSFRSYLHRINKTPSPNCNCLVKTVQTAHHLTQECSL